MTKEVKIKMEKEIANFTRLFEEKYGLTPERIDFFNSELPKFAEKVFEKETDLKKELWNFIDEYKERGLGGYNSTYGNIHDWLIDFAALLLGVDAFELRSGVVYE